MHSLILRYKNATFIAVSEKRNIHTITQHTLNGSSYKVINFKREKEQSGLPVEVHLPPIAMSDERNDVLALAEKMGYFKYGTSLIDKLQNCRSFKINDQYCDTRLDESWDEEVLNSLHECGYDTPVYYAESKADYPEDERFVIDATFEDICKATTQDGTTWSLALDDNLFKITFS